MKFIEADQMPIPDLFRCPISLELFTDPVTLCTGHTYDRPFIEKWLGSGKLTCPVTMQKLKDVSMVPNRTLSHLIHQWRVSQTASQNSPSPSPPLFLPHRNDDDEFLAGLKRTLESSSEEPIWEKKKLLALKRVNALFNQELPIRGLIHSLVKLGFFPLMIRLVFEEAMITKQGYRRSELIEMALSSALKLMPCCELDCLNMIKEEPQFANLTALFEQGTSTVKISLCRLLECVLSSSDTKELSRIISSSTSILRSIINLIKPNDDDDDEGNVMVSEAGIKAILALCSMETDQDHHHHRQQQTEIVVVLEKLVELGAIQVLIRCIWRDLSSERPPVWVQAAALEAVEVLVSKAQGGKEALLGEPNGVRALVKMVFRVSDHQQGGEKAVDCLMGLCCESVRAREEAIRWGVLTQLLLLIQSQCSGRTKTRGRLLLKILRSMWAKDPIRNAS